MEPNEKKAILLAALEERYGAMHRIRERVDAVGLWALGLLLAAGGWLLQADHVFTDSQKLLMVLGLAVSFWAIRFSYFADLKRGFVQQQRVSVRLEKALGFFTAGELDGGDDPVYPAEWQRAGTGDGPGRFFDKSYLLLYIGFGFVLVALLLNVGSEHGSHEYHSPGVSFVSFQVRPRSIWHYLPEPWEGSCWARW